MLHIKCRKWNADQIGKPVYDSFIVQIDDESMYETAPDEFTIQYVKCDKSGIVFVETWNPKNRWDLWIVEIINTNPVVLFTKLIPREEALEIIHQNSKHLN